jgi:hypothetical protein
VQWVEHGIAPDRIIAYHVTNGVQDFSRPVCPYPALPRYSGVGDTTKASSFVCAADRDHDDNQPPAPKELDTATITRLSRSTTATTVRRVTSGEGVIVGARIYINYRHISANGGAAYLPDALDPRCCPG